MTRPDEVAHLRVPPHSVENEQALLGAVLNDNAQFTPVAARVPAAAWYRPDHRAIWQTITGLITADRVADVLTVHDAGGHSLVELNALAGCVASPRNAPAYAEVVRARWVQRKIIGLCDEVASEAFRADMPTERLLDHAISALLALQGQGAAQGEPVIISELLPQVIDQVNALADGQTDAVATGLRALDDITSGGMRGGELWVIGARPSMGKTALQLAISRRTAAEHAALVCSMEDSANAMVLRHIAAAGRVNLSHLRRPKADSKTTWSGLSEGVDALSALRLYIDDQGGLSLLDVRRKIQHVLRRDAGLRVVVVDYLQLMDGQGESKNDALGRIANGLKKAAKEFGVTIVMLSQLNREADKRSGVPQISDLRDSGDIEGAGDVILLLHREFRRKPEPHLKHWAQVHVAKQKNGPTDIINLHFDGETQQFADWDGPAPNRGGAN